MLHHAARRGSLEALTKILELSPDLIYEKDVGSNTALHYAAMNGKYDSTQIMHFASNTCFTTMEISINFRK